MKDERFSRSRMLLGDEAMERLAAARVAVFGIGGVGGYVVEALARSGVGALDLIDNDTVALSNLNRQIIATTDTLGRDKVEVMAERVRSIHPGVRVTAHKCFYLPETAGQFDFSVYDYVVDAIDTVTGKIAIVLRAREAGVPVISAMGAGNKLDPSRFEVADLYDTSFDPLARVMRRELKKRGVESLKVVYSREKPLVPIAEDISAAEDGAGSSLPVKSAAGGETPEAPDIPAARKAAGAGAGRPFPGESPAAGNPRPAQEGGTDAPAPRKARRSTPGSLAFVPSVAGLIIAAEVVKDLACTGLPAGAQHA